MAIQSKDAKKKVTKKKVVRKKTSNLATRATRTSIAEDRMMPGFWQVLR